MKSRGITDVVRVLNVCTELHSKVDQLRSLSLKSSRQRPQTFGLFRTFASFSLFKSLQA